MSTTALLPGNGKSLLSQGTFDFGTISATGIVLHDNVSEEEWLKLTEASLDAYEYHGTGFARAALYVADLLNWGDAHLGERHAQAIDGTRAFLSRKEKTISNWRWIADKIPVDRRRENIDSLAIYEAVAKLPPNEQDEFLSLADKEAMTVKELKAVIRERHPSKPKVSKNGESDTEPAFTISNATDAKKAATLLINWLKANEEKLGESWELLLKDFYRIYDRRRKRASR